MPSRLLREGILDSEAVNSLTAEAEVFYRRLMSVVDDYGRFDGRASILRARLYPLKVATTTEADITARLAECDAAGLVAVYQVGGKPYVQLHRLGAPRAKESKYPPPPENTCQNTCEHPKTDENDQKTQMKTDVNGCAQTKTGAPYSGSGSYSYSGSDSRPTSGSGVSRPVADASEEQRYDPLREAERERKDFEAAWNAAGLVPIKRLPHSLHGRLSTLLGFPEWREIWREAIVRAGQIPFLAIGLGRRAGPLDPSTFLGEDDFAHAILRGKFNPRPQQAPHVNGKPPPAPVVTDPFAAIIAREEAEAARKDGAK